MSCDKYKEISKENLSHAFIQNSSPTFKGYFYKGSDNTYHYFISNWSFIRENYFKIPVRELKIIEPFKFEKDNKGQRLEFKGGNEKFAENEFYTLYSVKK